MLKSSKIWLFLLSFSIFFNAFSQKMLVLNAEKLNFTPLFSIDYIKDNRSNNTPFIGEIFKSNTEKENIAFKDGLVFALKKMCLQTFPPNPSAISIAYHILALNISEKRLPNGNISGEISLQVAFHRIGKKDTLLLTETGSSTTYLRSNNHISTEKYETILPALFINSFTYFNKWLLLNGGKHEALAKGIKIVFLPEPTENTGDTVCYHSRKITWDDFRGKAVNKDFEAAIFANFAFEASFQIANNYMIATIQTKTYMVRSMSWVLPQTRNAYSLAHEQLHFDIAKVIVERFKKKITLLEAESIIDLNSMIQYEYLESYRAMNQLQNLYDTESQHSINREKQAEWTEKITIWLSEK
jgi:hypothetical protein